MKIITVTGYKGGVGKSTTAIHLATYFSELGRTLLVDGDLNKTSLAWAARGEFPFEVVNQHKAMKAILGKEYVVIDTKVSELSIHNLFLRIYLPSFA